MNPEEFKQEVQDDFFKYVRFGAQRDQIALLPSTAKAGDLDAYLSLMVNDGPRIYHPATATDATYMHVMRHTLWRVLDVYERNNKKMADCLIVSDLDEELKVIDGDEQIVPTSLEVTVMNCGSDALAKVLCGLRYDARKEQHVYVAGLRIEPQGKNIRLGPTTNIEPQSKYLFEHLKNPEACEKKRRNRTSTRRLKIVNADELGDR